LPLAGSKPHQRKRPQSNPNQPQSWDPNGGSHAAHLAIATLPQRQFQPGGGDGAAKADGGIPWRQGGFLSQDFDLGRARFSPLDDQPLLQLLQGLGGGDPFHLNPVGALMAELGIDQAGIEATIIGQQEQPFAVAIQSPHRINFGHRNKRLEGRPSRLVGELGEHAIRLVELEIAHDTQNNKTVNPTFPIFKIWQKDLAERLQR
jgi:hypothetical protein